MFFCLLFCFVVIVVVNVFAFAAKHEIYMYINKTCILIRKPSFVFDLIILLKFREMICGYSFT